MKLPHAVASLLLAVAWAGDVPAQNVPPVTDPNTPTTDPNTPTTTNPNTPTVTDPNTPAGTTNGTADGNANASSAGTAAGSTASPIAATGGGSLSGAALTSALNQSVATTGVDPVAGNPNSLMSQMGASDFNAATAGAVARPGGIGLGARFGSFTVNGSTSRSYSLPLATSFELGEGRTLLLDAPLTMVDTDGARSYSASLGVGMTLPVRIGLPESLDWKLTPMLRFGGVGESDLGKVAGGLWSISLTSNLVWQALSGMQVEFANMVTWLQTLPINYGGYDVGYELTNDMYRNGLLVTQDVGELFGRAAQATLFAIDTRFTGDALYVESNQEFGDYVTLGGASPISLGLTVLTGDQGYGGVTINLGSVF